MRIAPLAFVLLACASTTTAPEEVAAFAAVLLARSGASEDFERAAFLTRDHDGSLSLVEWDFERSYRRAVWRGAIPKTAIAVMHTHPSHLRQPSIVDVEEAVRIKMPFIVVTRQYVCIATPDRHVTCSGLSYHTSGNSP